MNCGESDAGGDYMINKKFAGIIDTLEFEYSIRCHKYWISFTKCSYE